MRVKDELFLDVNDPEAYYELENRAYIDYYAIEVAEYAAVLLGLGEEKDDETSNK